LNAKLPATVPEVIERLRAIEASASRSDGVACFARLYRQVTEGVNAELGQQTFANPRFLESLDICFAGLFFSALDAYQSKPAGAPSAWAPLFSQRARRGIAPLQFALAGMNAHINRDLPVAVVAACEKAGIEPHVESPQHRDYVRVNAVLAKVEARVKRSYLIGWLRSLDRLVHRVDRLDDVVAMWNVARARDAAWANGEALWALRQTPQLAADFLASLDRMVGLAGRGLLIPSDSLLGRLARRVSRLGPDPSRRR